MASEERPHWVVDPILGAAMAVYDAVGSCANFCDAEWFYVHSTPEYLRIAPGFAAVPVGSHWFGPEITGWMRDTIGPRHSRRQEFLTVGPWVLFDTPGGREVLRRRVDPSLVELIDDLVPEQSPIVRGGSHLDDAGMDVPADGSRHDLMSTVVRVHDAAGRFVGRIVDYRPPVPMSHVFSSLALADLRHLERMAAVATPDRRPAAILFADLESSTPLAKRVPTAEFFAFGRRMVRAVDQCLIDHGGIVGRHAGDGVTGFFLAETVGSESAAARSCIEAARDLRTVLAEVVARSSLGDEAVSFRFGLHWGARPYIGRITTAGRTEVTGLGDEVNDAARIEACASGGRALASKDLIECLTPADAEVVGIDLKRTTFTVLAELPTATEKARRDAPALAVCEV